MRFASIQCSKMRLRSGLRPGPRWGAYIAPSPLSWFYGGRFAAGRGGEREERGRGEEREKRGRVGGEGEGRLTLMRNRPPIG